MEIFLAALVVFGIAFLGLAIGVLLSNRSLRGTCGGLSGLRDEEGRTLCDACTTPSEECSVDSVRAAEKARQESGKAEDEEAVRSPR